MDVATEAQAQNVVNHILRRKEEFIFIMVSGMEVPDLPNAGKNGSEEQHIHIGFVVNRPLTRQQALELVQPMGIATTPGSVYAVPRNPKFPYVGWICHHSKAAFKVQGQPGLRLEHGMLPMDSFDTPKLEAIDRMIKKFGNEEMKKRFKFYQDALRTLKELEASPPVEDEDLAVLPEP